MMEKNIPEIFGSMVFNETAMQQYLPEETFRSLMATIEMGKSLDLNLANEIASAMKEWAIQKGATHFTHWFQPMTGITAEKHDSFLSLGRDGKVIMDFSGKELIKGESDASSFPSGGLRATFEARGYTAWDPTSYAFIKDKTLCIPTAFCTFSGEALDKKTPLLRSMQAINKQSVRVLHALGNTDVHVVRPTVGAEQEYFLIDQSVYNQRKDLVYTGRTLYGNKPPKGQDLEDHYYGSIKHRVLSFMHDLDVELWKLGVLAKTEHNEVAPAQHELAPIFNTVNIATDHNQLTMEMMKKIASNHGMVCLLHEKPFEGVNGSGKHINWSLQTDTGENLFEPGDTPHTNARFLLFVCAVLKAVDKYQDLLRISVASAGNDHRLGANEAPPAVVSAFLGDELTDILTSIETGSTYSGHEVEPIKVGVHVLPKFSRDTTDRNRTSPFAFTGNKFELRMLGSAASVAEPCIVLNTIVADVLEEFASKLENSSDIQETMHDIISDVMKNHKRIIFNGNGYDDSWVEEATKNRKLLNLKTTPDCLPYWITKNNVDLFVKHKVFTEGELRSRSEISLENYIKIVNIEALTMLDMAEKDIFPAVSKYIGDLCNTVLAQEKILDILNISPVAQNDKIAKLTLLLNDFSIAINKLHSILDKAKELNDFWELSVFYRDYVLISMNELRTIADEMESYTSSEFWPFPVYGDLLFSV